MELNREQQRAVDHGGGPLMVLAGAGSGKTRVLVNRIGRLVAEARVPPHRILAVTFTNKAAAEMRERLRKLLGARADSMWIGTFHSTCARILRIYHEAAGIPRDFAIFDDDDQMRLMTSLLKEKGIGDEISPRSILTFIDRAKNRGDDPTKQRTGAYVDDYVRRIYPDYREALVREGALDFNDLLLEVLKLCEDDELGPELARRFDHVLVDEFQDTNLVQYRLVKHLSRATHNLCVVGDDDQSIYSWRGAEPRNLLDFDRDFADAEVVKLEQNYRSTSTILNVANAVIRENLDRHEKRLWTERDGGELVLWEEAADERAEAEFIARAIRGLSEQEGREHGDFAVLYRTHAQSRVLEEMLRAYRIGYRIVGGVSFFQRKEIKDIRSYARLVFNPAADSAFERVINTPARGIGKTTVDRVRARARASGISLMESARQCAAGQDLAIKPATCKKLAAFVDIIDGLGQVERAHASVSELIIQAVERSGYRIRLEQEDTVESRDRLANLSELVTMASDFDDETEGKGTLAEFEERISLASAADDADGRASSMVTLTTVHAAKGLEFPIVFVCGLEDGLFPSLRMRDGSDERRALEEERRLAYVAFTRAMDRLVLSSARMRRQWGEVRLCTPSRFVDAVPAELLAVREQRAPRPRPPLASFARPQRRVPDDLDQRTYDDDVPAFEVDADLTEDDLVGPGSTVTHAAFGSGRVLSARGEGRDRKLDIDFGGVVGVKTVLARWVVATGA